MPNYAVFNTSADICEPPTPHTPSIDGLGFDCGVYLSHSLAFLLRQVIYKLRRISLHGIKKLQIKLTQVHSKRKHDVLYKQCNHISFVSPFDLSVQTCNVSIMFGKEEEGQVMFRR